MVSFGRMNWRMGEGFRDRDDWKGDGRRRRRRGLRSSKGRGISIVMVEGWFVFAFDFLFDRQEKSRATSVLPWRFVLDAMG